MDFGCFAKHTQQEIKLKKIICDVPQEKGATYLREFPQTFLQFPASIPTKFPQLTTRNFPEPDMRCCS